MACFPQLQTGGVGQFPLRRQRSVRTAATESPEGHVVKLGDADSESLTWLLRLSGLTDQEWGSIESFFEAREGSLGSFTFLDPADNLLAWSEDLTETAWQADPLLQPTGAIADPFGDTRATRVLNTGQAAQNIFQSVTAPADFHYCLSLYARSDQQVSLTLKRFSATANEASVVTVSSTWRRFASAGNLAAAEEPVNFGIEVPSGASIDVYGLQVEPQPAPSGYRRTGSHGGVYPKARFLDDALEVVTEQADRHSCVIRVYSTMKD